MNKLFGLLFYFSNLMDARSSNPVLAALIRAERGAVLATIGSLIAIVAMFMVAPSQDALPIGSSMTLVRDIQHWCSLGFACVALVATLFGLYQIGRYILIIKWPERFVDFND